MFLCCDFSSCWMTTRPVGRWVIRTALSVVLTDWPPGPGRAVDVDAQVRVVDLDVDLLRFRKHRDRRRRSVDPAAALRHRDALDPVDAAFIFQPGEHALAADRGDHLLVAAHFRRAGRDELDLPALALGVALVHPEEVAGEQGRLVAAGAGADLEHRRPLVGGVARQQLERQRPFRLGQLGLEVGELLRRHLPDLGARIGQHLREQLDLGPDPPDLAGGDGDRLDLGIILGESDELVGREPARRHGVLKLLAPRLDGGDPFGRDGGHAFSTSAKARVCSSSVTTKTRSRASLRRSLTGGAPSLRSRIRTTAKPSTSHEVTVRARRAVPFLAFS